MARSINLLPPELSPKKVYLTIGRKIKTISIVGYVLLLVVIASVSISFLIFSRRIDTLSQKQESLQEDLGNLKKSEATIVILKDRADKSKEIFDSNLTRSSVDAFYNLKNGIPVPFELSELSIENEGVQVSATTLNSQDLEGFVKYLISSDIFEKIRLTEMTRNRNGKYTISFVMEI